MEMRNALQRARSEMPKESFFNGDGVRVGRLSPDDAWPLTRADGRTWAQHRPYYRKRLYIKPCPCRAEECQVGCLGHRDDCPY